jgi:type I restriction enzyme S subunit
MTDFRFRELVDSGWLLVNDGYRAKVDELGGGGALFLRAGALQDDGFRWRGLDSFTPGAKIESKRGHSGDVVITTKGNSVGRVGWVPESAPDFVYSPHLSFWRSLDEKHVVPRYLYYWSRSPVFAAQVRNLAFGTDMAPYLSLRDQLELRIDLPEAAEQQRIAGCSARSTTSSKPTVD